MRVYVVMGNSYPDCVYRHEVAAKRFCDEKTKRQKTHSLPAIHWRYYEFELQEDE